MQICPVGGFFVCLYFFSRPWVLNSSVSFISNQQLYALLRKCTDVCSLCLHPCSLTSLHWCEAWWVTILWKARGKLSRPLKLQRPPNVRWRRWIYFLKLPPPEYGWALYGKSADATQNELCRRESLQWGLLSNIHHFLIILLEYSAGSFHYHAYQPLAVACVWI